MSRLAMHAPNSLTIGLDLGDKRSRLYALDGAGHRSEEAVIPTTRAGLQYFAGRPPCRVVLEVGTHSPWVSRELTALGHEVLLANPSAMFVSRRRRRRNDRIDAEFLARQGRADPKLLHPIQHRGVEAQQHLELLRARDQVVHARTKLINHVRGAVKSLGSRLSRCSAEAFAQRAAQEVPDMLVAAVRPLLELIAELTRRIRDYDRQLETVIHQHYPVAQRLRQPAGVGPITALA